MNREKMQKYLQHLDKEGLMHAVMYLIEHSEDAKKTLIMMSEEWDKIYAGELR